MDAVCMQLGAAQTTVESHRIEIGMAVAYSQLPAPAMWQFLSVSFRHVIIHPLYNDNLQNSSSFEHTANWHILSRKDVPANSNHSMNLVCLEYAMQLISPAAAYFYIQIV